MHSPRILAVVVLAGAHLPLFGALAIAQNAGPAAALTDSKSDSKGDTKSEATTTLAMASLKVCLRLEDETPFLGAASVRVLPDQGNELLGMPADAAGEFLFSGVTAGKYNIYIIAPGFLDQALTTQLDGGAREKMLFVPMKHKDAAPVKKDIEIILVAPEAVPSPAAAPASQTTPATAESLLPKNDVAPAETTSGTPAEPASPAEAVSTAASGALDYWSPHELEQPPPVDPAVTCPADQVLGGVGKRMAEFVDTLEKFTATEKLEHFSIDRNGNRKSPETRTFPYVVSVKQNQLGTFLLEEFRNGSTDAQDFPAHTATRGSPAMALIFHPALAGGFDFRCEGMGQWQGRQVWLVHFVQRPDKPIQIRSYTVNGRSFGVALEGRVWIDPGTDEVVHLESELAKPIDEIALTREHFAIDYKPVQFRSTGQQVWLPQDAELYVERKGKRFYRRHSFSDFMLFNVDATQNVRAPGESFSFTNSSDYDVNGELTVARREGAGGEPVMLRFVVPAHGRVFKVVGPGKDVNMPVSAVGAATFVHEGEANAVKVDAHLLKETSLDVISQIKLPVMQPAAPPPAQP